MPASEIQEWIPVLQELWLTAACKVLAEHTEVSFEVDDTRATETSRPLGVCSEFELRIGDDTLGKILFGVPAASREISELALLVVPPQGRSVWEDEFGQLLLINLFGHGQNLLCAKTPALKLHLHLADVFQGDIDFDQMAAIRQAYRLRLLRNL